MTQVATPLVSRVGRRSLRGAVRRSAGFRCGADCRAADASFVE